MKTVPVLIAVALYFGLSFAVYTDDITEARAMGGYGTPQGPSGGYDYRPPTSLFPGGGANY